MELGEELIRRLERLARLELTESERRRLGADLARILEYVAQIESLDTAGISATTHVGAEESSLRPDRPGPCLPREQVLRAAPRAAEGYFQVPAVLDAEGDPEHA